MFHLSSFLVLIRMKNSVMASVSGMIGILAVRGQIDPLTVLYAMISAFLISSASFAINDVCDRRLDESSARLNPLTKGDISPNQAAAIAVSFSIAGFCAAILTKSWITYSLAGISALVGFVYSLYLKPSMPTIGNLATSYSFGITFVGGASVFGLPNLLATGAVFFMCAISMTANFSRELIKGIADCEGDGRWGIRTVAVTRGPRFAAGAALFVMMVAIGLTYVPFVLGIFRGSYVVVITLADILLVTLTASVYLSPTVETAIRVKKDLLNCMLIGLVAFLIGPHFEYYSIYAVPFEALAAVIFVVLLRKLSVKNLWSSFTVSFLQTTETNNARQHCSY